MSDRERKQPTKEQRDERVAIPLDPEKALKGLLQVDPESEPARDERPAKSSDRYG
jgi:hypothetical protein